MLKNQPGQQVKQEAKRKYLNYSQVFYQKENLIRDLLVSYDNIAQKMQEHKKMISNQNYETFINFSDCKIDAQRQLMQSSSMKIMQSLLDIVQNLHHDRKLMQYVIPTIDGILFGTNLFRQLNTRCDLPIYLSAPLTLSLPISQHLYGSLSISLSL